MGRHTVALMPRPKRTPESHPYAEIGERLQFIREFFELDQPDMAAKAGISLSTYNNCETGSGRISLDAAKRLRRQLQVSLDFIYEGDTAALSAMLSKAWLSRS